MAKFFSSAIELLIGYFIAPFVVRLIGSVVIIGLLALVGVNNPERFIELSFLGVNTFELIVIGILFFVRKTVALGYLLSVVLDIFSPGA